MSNPTPSSNSADPYNLNRFLEAQARDYVAALAELRSGRKRTHWMWYVFPQFKGLGYSSTSQHFAIGSVEEARAYLAHPVLGARLRECAEAVMNVEGKTAREIFGSPDDLKLKSSATLFERVAGEGSLFAQLLVKYFAGQRDERTLELLGEEATD